MSQAALFAASPQEQGMQPALFHPDFASWQVLARHHLSQRTEPSRIWWQPAEACAAAGADLKAGPSPGPGSAGSEASVPRDFVEKARAAACHRNPDRWDLLYRMLWRLTQGERHLLQLHGDPQVLQLNGYVRSVTREVHKMKAFVRFRLVKAEDEDARDDERYVAWFEPEHDVVRYASGFFRRRFASMRWSILTPLTCAHFEGAGDVWFSAGVGKEAGPTMDEVEDLWRLYYRSIFNPARLKVNAMLAEMPRRYWKNLPEAQLIPSLVQEANRRLAGMQALTKSSDESRCGPRPASPATVASARLASSQQGSLAQLALQAASCRRCPLWEPATQTVWGEGPADARIMLVGEQPGDQEDLQGRPFVGPAGRLLDRALAQAGLDRRRLYLTNTVKHFKFKSRGKRRLHDKPLEAEMLACVPWLEAEIQRIEPTLVVCLGATAARAQLGRAVRIAEERGRILAPADANPSDASRPMLLLTFHPSYLLRLPEAAAAADAYQKLVADLRLARQVALGLDAELSTQSGPDENVTLQDSPEGPHPAATRTR
jgi:probable DNA metabolism protein